MNNEIITIEVSKEDLLRLSRMPTGKKAIKELCPEIFPIIRVGTCFKLTVPTIMTPIYLMIISIMDDDNIVYVDMSDKLSADTSCNFATPEDVFEYYRLQNPTIITQDEFFEQVKRRMKND